MSRRLKNLIFFTIPGFLLSLIILLPLYMMIMNSFKDRQGAAVTNLRLPDVWQIIENYSEVIHIGKLGLGFLNSMIITFSSVALILLLTSAAAFVIQRRSGKGIAFVSTMIILGLIVPLSIIPTTFLLKYLGLLGTYFGTILVYVATCIPFSVFIYTGFYRTIPRALDEVATLDGCGPFRLYFQVIFPLVKPATLTILIANFMTVWNDLNIVIYLINTPSKYTAVMTTYLFYGQYNSSWNLVFADIILISLPVVILYLFLQKYIVSGMTAGSIKG